MVDGYNEDRFVNILDEDLATKPVTHFSNTLDFPELSGTTDSRAEFIGLSNGNLTASSVQYTYQYYNVNGSATRYAPLSPPIAIPATNPDGLFSKYRGGELDEQTGFGCNIQVNVPVTNSYNRLRLVALDYSTLNAVPVVRVFQEIILDTDSTITELTFTDIGDTIDEIVYEDFLLEGNVIYKSVDLAVKNNILFKANVSEDSFDIDFDARAYRFDSTGISDVYDSDLTTKYTITGSTGAWTYNSGADTGTDWSIPTTADAINLYNGHDYDTNSAYQFKYQVNGSTLGAEGKNVKVTYSVQNTSGLDNTTDNDINLPVAGQSPGHPYNSTYNRNFQRQEVYRIGIIFYDRKLRPSSVKWICDAKMPSSFDGSGYNFVKYSTPRVTASLLGLQVELLNDPTDDYYGWQIVHVPRDSDDRSVVFNGILQTPFIDVDDSTQSHPLSDSYDSAYTDIDLTDIYQFHRTSFNSDLNILISPEINYNYNSNYINGDYLQLTGYFTVTTANIDSTINNGYQKLRQFSSSSDFDYTSSLSQADVDDFQIAPQTDDSDAIVEVGGVEYNNYAKNRAGDDQFGLHGTCGVAQTLTPFSLGNTATPEDWMNRVPVFSYKRNKFASQYGGVDYYARNRNTYQACSEVRYTTTTNVTYEGDTFIDYFWYQKQAFDLEQTGLNFKGLKISTLFPIESTICPTLRYDTIDTNLASRELAGTWTIEAGLGIDVPHVQLQDFYLYNSVYSLTNKGQVYISSNLDESDQTYFPTRVRYSDTKESGEISDSFTIFRSDNYIDVDGRYGGINNLTAFKNKLYYWQDSAFGILSINDRALIQDDNPGVLALGSGGVLDRYDYISDTTGNTNPHGIITSNTGIYWIDNNKNEFVKFDGNVKSESKLKGIQSWINDTGRIGWAIGTYDNKYNDIIFTLGFSRTATPTYNVGEYTQLIEISDDSDLDITEVYDVVINGRYEDGTSYSQNNNIRYEDNGQWRLSRHVQGDIGDDYNIELTIKEDSTKRATITFNEQINQFIDYPSFKPLNYIKVNRNYFTCNDGYTLYKHNSDDAEKSTYYDVTYPSIIRTVFTKDYPYTKVYDVMKWLTDSRDEDDINIFEDGFNEVSIYNDYQHTGDRSLYYQENTPPATMPTPMSRRERTWSMQVPRDIVNSTVASNPDIFNSSNWDETNGRNSRIRDKYMVAEFTYNNSDNYAFSVPFISTSYRKSYR